jgi:cell division protein FtsZ
MYKQGIRGVDFILANTDSQVLGMSEVPVKIQLGANLTEGMGAGSIPEIGRQAAMESTDEIKKLLETNTKMAFITAGMGGGTGTGAAPVIASIAKDLGILTVGIVTIPFAFEGRKRRQQAEKGIEEMRKYVDTLLVICNDKLRELEGDLKLSQAFSQADNILTIAAKGIAEIITVTGYINVDFNDVKTVMKESGVAIMGTGIAEGENRSRRAVEDALNSPLLDDNDIEGAKNILLYISSGTEEVTMDEVMDITDYIQDEAGSTAEIIWGNGTDDTLGAAISVTLIATGFKAGSVQNQNIMPNAEVQKTVIKLENVPEEKKPVDNVKEDDFKVITREQIPAPETISKFKLEDEPAKEEKKEPYMPLANQDSGDFELKIRQPQTEQTKKEVVLNIIDSEQAQDNSWQVKEQSTKPPQTQEEKEMYEKMLDRQKRLRDLSTKIRQPGGLEELENEPAYKRRNVELTDVKPSDQSSVSRYVMGEDEDKKPEIKNNPYLHDNVD